jgi:hypothetical protein
VGARGARGRTLKFNGARAEHTKTFRFSGVRAERASENLNSVGARGAHEKKIDLVLDLRESSPLPS